MSRRLSRTVRMMGGKSGADIVRGDMRGKNFKQQEVSNGVKCFRDMMGERWQALPHLL